jgi:cellulose synthase/poly-beta-1,6-N-acetylglucosamine synthase-like glycosyltransferase
MRDILVQVTHFILLYFIGSVAFYTFLLISAFFSIIYFFRRAKYSNLTTLLATKILPPVTIIIPAYNEKENILNVIESSLKSTYSNLYVIAINDASTDDTLNIIKEHYQLFEVPVIIEGKIPTSEIKAVYVSKTHANLTIIDKQKNCGAGDSLNIGINACFTPYFVTVDADSLIEPDAITEFIYEAMTNESAIVVGGGVYIINGCKYKNGVMIESLLSRKLVPALQSLEYIRSHLFSRTGWNIFGGTMSYSGTATLFDRKAVTTVGGFDTHNFAQDAEVIMKLHAYMRKNKIPYKILFNPSATVWTDVPDTFAAFATQRDRWRRGLLRGVLRYWYMFFNPRYGIQGMICYPAYILLEILGPIIEFTAYFCVAVAYFLHMLNGYQAILYIILAWGFVSYLTIANMFINLVTFNRYKRTSDIFRIFMLAIIETFGFRQYSVLVSIYGTFHYFINRLRGKPL